MKTRYTTIKPSTVYKDDKGVPIPDLFSFPIRDFKAKEKAYEYTVTQMDIDRFDILIEKYYGLSDFIDIILWLNGIFSLDDIEPGYKILLFARTDLENFYRENYAYRRE